MIRYQVEDHETRMKTWKGWLDMAWIIPLALIALPFAYAFRFYERWKHDECVRCGHVHKGPLTCADPHGWEKTKTCTG